MKKIAPLALSALLLGAGSAGAEQPVTPEGAQQTEVNASFYQTSGKITGAETFGEGKLFFSDNEGNEFHFNVTDETLVFDKKGNKVALKEGDTVTLYVYANQPMILIYPPRYTPAVIIVGEETEPNFVKVSAFDKNFVSEDNDLKLNLQDDTVIVNAKGEKQTKEAITKQNAIVFYGASTFSIPAQTSPEKVVLFPKLEDPVIEPAPTLTPKISDIVGGDFYEVDGKVMVPLRVVSEALGYKVTSTGKGAILSKGPVSYVITRGEKMYGYNRALRQFDVAPALLETNKTYVEYDFALDLLN